MLDNPIWHSLRTRHAHLAIECGSARRYPPQVTPFVAVPSSAAAHEPDLRQLVQPGEKVGILNVSPEFTDHWQPVYSIQIHQYVWPDSHEGREDPEAQLLGEDHISQMIELTSLVYPAYFRPDTARLGSYFGIFDDGKLCAMAGIRMSMDGHQELSAICTHPDFRGRGFASRLTNHLVSHVRAQGDIAFLHTESDNDPAQKVYQRLGFQLRKVMPFQVLQRV